MTTSCELSKDVYLTGWGHSRFGKRDESLEELVVAAASTAIANSGVDPADIDEVVIGHFNSGLMPFAFPSSLALQVSDKLGGIAATRVENACASGAAAFTQGTKSILAGTAHNVLVIGAEKMTHAPTDLVGRALMGADYEGAGSPSTTGFASLFARTLDTYQQRYGAAGDTLGMIAAKSHHNAMSNPYAHLRKDLSVEFCSTVSERNPIVAGSLLRTDCSPVSDGAAAIVIRSQTSADAATDPVRLTGFGHANDFLPQSKRDPIEFAGSRAAWNRAMQMSGLTRDDLDFAEVHDCFTIAELIMYEVIGVTQRGHGRLAIEEGLVARDGKFPVNPSGGLKSKGHPVGATGVSQLVLTAMQLSGTAAEMQLPGARRAAVHNMGGLAIANYVHVLEAM